MVAKNHIAYKKEEDRLELTKAYICKTLDATEEYRKLYKDSCKK